MAKPRKKVATVGAHAPAVLVRAPGERDYIFMRPHTHAGIDYAAGDAITLTDARAELIRRFAGADALAGGEG